MLLLKLDIYHLSSMLSQIPSHVTPLLTIFDFDPEEVARQMTIIDFSLFAKIKPSELLNQVGTLPSKYVLLIWDCSFWEVLTHSLNVFFFLFVGVAEDQVQASGTEHPASGGSHEQPHLVGGHHHIITEGEHTELVAGWMLFLC